MCTDREILVDGSDASSVVAGDCVESNEPIRRDAKIEVVRSEGVSSEVNGSFGLRTKNGFCGSRIIPLILLVHPEAPFAPSSCGIEDNLTGRCSCGQAVRWSMGEVSPWIDVVGTRMLRGELTHGFPLVGESTRHCW